MPRDYEDAYEDDDHELDDAYEPEDDYEAGPEERFEHGPGLLHRLGERLGFHPVRPGEHDIIRSPLVLILTISMAVLVLVAAIYWFMILRESASREFAAAEQEMNEGKYTQAIEHFESFLGRHSIDHPQAVPAKFLLGKSRVLKEVSGATPDWGEGLTQLQAFIKSCRDLEGFQEQEPFLLEQGEAIARGAAQLAVNQKGNALLERSPELLRIAQEAAVVVNRYSPQDDKPTELLDELNLLKRRTEALILRQQTFVDGIASISKLIDGNQPIEAMHARRQLIEQYSEFRNDRELRQLMESMLDLEKSLIVPEDIDREATAGRAGEVVPHLTLTVHTRARTDEVPSGQLAFAVAKNCLYAADTNTGDPVWRQTIGLDTPFFPIEVSASVPALLSFNADTLELLLLEQATGNILWRQAVGERVTGPPVIHEGQLYLATRNRHLFKINLESGRITSALKFSQGILSPVLHDEQLLVPGESSVMYTVSLRPLACQSVSFIGHKVGTIEAPLLRMGNLILMAENSESSRCTLHALRWDSSGQSVSVTDTKTIEGRVFEQPTLRGSDLFITSTGQRITAFTVSDDPNNPPLTEVASVQVEGVYDGPMYVDAGPNGQLWLGTNALRKLELRSRTINVDPITGAPGLCTQPLQGNNDEVYLARRPPFAEAVYFSQIDRQTLTGYWRIVFGAGVLASMPRGENTRILVTETGHIFRVTLDDFAANRFLVEPTAQLRLPDSLEEPLQGVRLDDERLAVYCGGAEPQLWTINAVGQIDRSVSLDQPLEAPPVPVNNGVAVALPGRLKLIARPTGAARVDDYVAPVDQDLNRRWLDLIAISDDQFVAIDSQKKLMRFEYRTTPTPHLAEVSTVTLDQPVDRPLAIVGGQIVLADATGQLMLLDALNFETTAQAQLDGTPTAGPWTAGSWLIVEVDDGDVSGFQLGGPLEPAWQLQLTGGGLSGAPLLLNDRFIAAQRDGQILAVDAASGASVDTVNLAEALATGPLPMGDTVVIPGIDGTLHRLDKLLPSAE